jgi:O-succinylbenzoic acid--CoA ligase
MNATPDDTPLLVIAGRTCTRRQLLALDPAGPYPAAPYTAPPDTALGENARAAQTFAREWLAGAERFALYTSGSTGTPKPIGLTRRQMEASARATGAALGLRRGGQALVCLPARYVAGRMMLVRCLVLGLLGHVVEPAADPFATSDSSVHLDFAAFVPLQLQALLDVALYAPGDSCFAEETARAFRYRRLLEGMGAILVGGGPVSDALQNQIAQLSAPVYHTYGMTETATHIALRRLNGPDAAASFVPLPGVELTQDARGCLAIRGAVTEGEWVQTNDLVDLAADSSFVWVGRWDNVINSGGVKVQVETVEAAVEALQRRSPDLPWGGRKLAVAGVPDARLGQMVALVLEGAPLTDVEEAALENALRGELDRYARPRRIVYLPALPETPTGKIDRRALLAMLHGE